MVKNGSTSPFISFASSALTLPLCMLGNIFIIFCHLIFFSQKKSFWDIIRVSNRLDPDLARHSFVADEGP